MSDYICSFSYNNGAFSDFYSLVDYCYHSTVNGRILSESSCIKYYMPDCQPYEASVSSSSGNDFDFNEVKRGFNDFNDIFVLMFACFLLVKLIWLAK